MPLVGHTLTVPLPEGGALCSVPEHERRAEIEFHFAIEPKLTGCAHCGCKLYEGGHREKVGGKERMFCCCHCAHSYRQDRSVA